MSQHLEPDVPADFVFGLRGEVRIFGLQFKALYPRPDHWKLERVQHATMQRYRWIYYGLSEVTSANEEAVALELLRLKEPNFRYQSRLYRGDGGTKAWGDMQRRLLRGDWGERVKDEADFVNLFVHAWDRPLMIREGNNMADLFLVNIDELRVARIAPTGTAL